MIHRGVMWWRGFTKGERERYTEHWRARKRAMEGHLWPYSVHTWFGWGADTKKWQPPVSGIPLELTFSLVHPPCFRSNPSPGKPLPFVGRFNCRFGISFYQRLCLLTFSPPAGKDSLILQLSTPNPRASYIPFYLTIYRENNSTVIQLIIFNVLRTVIIRNCKYIYVIKILI